MGAAMRKCVDEHGNFSLEDLYKPYTNVDLQPSNLTDFPWIVENDEERRIEKGILKSYPIEDNGKWMLFYPVEKMDALWAKAKQLYRDGGLPGVLSMKVSTQDLNSTKSSLVLILYCGPASDENHIMTVGKMIKLQLVPDDYLFKKMFYKTDHQTTERRKLSTYSLVVNPNVKKEIAISPLSATPLPGKDSINFEPFVNALFAILRSKTKEEKLSLARNTVVNLNLDPVTFLRLIAPYSHCPRYYGMRVPKFRPFLLSCFNMRNRKLPGFIAKRFEPFKDAFPENCGFLYAWKLSTSGPEPASFSKLITTVTVRDVDELLNKISVDPDSDSTIEARRTAFKEIFGKLSPYAFSWLCAMVGKCLSFGIDFEDFSLCLGVEHVAMNEEWRNYSNSKTEDDMDEQAFKLAGISIPPYPFWSRDKFEQELAVIEEEVAEVQAKANLAAEKKKAKLAKKQKLESNTE